jgi:hypothetical protein
MRRTTERLRSEFLEMPGLRLTRWQVQRLCGIDEEICHVILDALVDAKFLRLHSDGTYALVGDGEPARARLARTDPIPPSARKAS